MAFAAQLGQLVAELQTVQHPKSCSRRWLPAQAHNSVKGRAAALRLGLIIITFQPPQSPPDAQGVRDLQATLSTDLAGHPLKCGVAAVLLLSSYVAERSPLTMHSGKGISSPCRGGR